MLNHVIVVCQISLSCWRLQVAKQSASSLQRGRKTTWSDNVQASLIFAHVTRVIGRTCKSHLCDNHPSSTAPTHLSGDCVDDGHSLLVGACGVSVRGLVLTNIKVTEQTPTPGVASFLANCRSPLRPIRIEPRPNQRGDLSQQPFDEIIHRACPFSIVRDPSCVVSESR